MEKSQIVKLMTERHRGIYNVIVAEYSSAITLPGNILKLFIEGDLENHTAKKVQLQYFSLVRAVARYKKKNPTTMPKESGPIQMDTKSIFKDEHELVEERKKNKIGGFDV